MSSASSDSASNWLTRRTLAAGEVRVETEFRMASRDDWDFSHISSQLSVMEVFSAMSLRRHVNLGRFAQATCESFLRLSSIS